jgi:hypothetical protein
MDGITTPDADKHDAIDKDRMERERQEKLDQITWKQVAGKWQLARETLKKKLKGLGRYEELAHMEALAANAKLTVIAPLTRIYLSMRQTNRYRTS